MSLQTYLQLRQDWRQQAPEALAALEAGDLEPARHMLRFWSFSGSPELSSALLEELLGVELQVAPQALAMTLGEPGVSGVATAHEWRTAAYEAGAAPPEPVAPRLWALAELAALGWLVEATERAPWAAVEPRLDPAADARAAELWRAWADMSIFDHEDAWEALTMKPMLRAFAAVLRGRRVPADRLRIALGDAREGWFPYLYGGDAESMSWRELAVLIIEAAGSGGPVQAMARALPEDRWDLVSRCAVTRGYGPETARMVWGEHSAWLVQARDLRRRGSEQPAWLDELLDLHVASRQVQRWQAPGPTAPLRSWNVVRHNRGRARARLRAVLREAPAEVLVEQLAAIPGLAWRTRSAVARFGTYWAWQCYQNGLSFADGRTLDPACHMPTEFVPAYTPYQVEQLRSWVLNVLVKGRLAHLEAWCTRKAPDDVDMKDAAWGRLLKDEIPDELRSAGPGTSRDDGLQRLRAELVEHLPGILQQLCPVVERVAAIQDARAGMVQAFERATAAVVRPEVKPLKIRYRSYITHARQVLPLLQARLDGAEDEEDQ